MVDPTADAVALDGVTPNCGLSYIDIDIDNDGELAQELDSYNTNFHPEFAEPTALHDIVLETDDCVCFYSSSELLAEHSIFFRDMLSFAKPHIETVNADGYLAIPLPSARSSSLRFVLDILEQYDNATQPSLGDMTIEVMVSAFELADAYDITAIQNIPRSILVEHFEGDPFRQYAVAAIFRQEKDAKIASWATFGLNPSHMPADALSLLHRADLSYYRRLLDLTRYTSPACCLLGRL